MQSSTFEFISPKSAIVHMKLFKQVTVLEYLLPKQKYRKQDNYIKSDDI